MELDYRIKDKEYYDLNKSIFNAKYNEIYKENYSPKIYIGDCSYLYKIFTPTSYEDFFNKYLNYGCPDFSLQTHSGSKMHGRNHEQLKYLAECYYGDIKKEFPDAKETLQECFDNLVNHIIIETFDGHAVERYLVNFILGWSENYRVKPCIGDLDSKLGIDFIITKQNDESYVRYIQVKPHTFFLFTKTHKALINDRINAFEKERKLKSTIDSNGCIEYLIYDANEFNKTKTIKLATKDDKMAFKLYDIINEDGQPKFDIVEDFEYHEIPRKQKEIIENNQ